MAGAAQGAVDSLLGRLTSMLLDEAQLLGGLRGDVEFIRDEMETMNALLRHLTEAQHRNHLVRAWMKQLVGLARDSEGNVELYLHRFLRLLRSLPARHRIATRIRELKVRARDVGDRRMRYGVIVPDSVPGEDNIYDGNDEESPRMAADPEKYLRRSALLLDAAEPPPDPEDEEVVRRGVHTLIKYLSMEPAREDAMPAPLQVRVFSIIGTDLADRVAYEVYQHSSVATIFSCKAWSGAPKNIETALAEILEQVGGVQLQPGQEEDEVTNQAAATTVDREKQLICKIQGHLKRKRFLIVVTTHRLQEWEWKRIRVALLEAADGSLPGSAIIMTTADYFLVMSSSPYKIFHARPPRCRRVGSEFYIAKSMDLRDKCPAKIRDIFHLCHTDTFAMKTFLHLLYVNRYRREDELQNYKNALSECIRLNRSISKQVLAWCYSELPSKYRSCLLYLIVFPEGDVIRTTSLSRRWVAEGLITATTTSRATDEIWSSTDEAEHCLDVLFIRGFISFPEISDEGNIKSYTVHREVREFIARVSTDVNFVDSNLPPHLAQYLSIHNRIGLQKSISDGDDSNDIAAYIPSLSASPQWQLLKVLDLEGCKGLDKNKNLKSICKILLLKYFSLRNTDVTQLPKQMKELQFLETLDIRQTKVPVLAKKAIVFPLLKHFLAGDKISVSNDARKSEGSFSAVEMPLGIHRMNNLEILSHVQVTNSSSEHSGIAKLLKLRKLGVALRGTSAKLSDPFRQIDKLHKCLRSLSLNISGLTSALPHMIVELHQLAKLTLTETYLNEDGLRILGKLRGLRCLRLLHKSYIESELSFKQEEFQTLNFLLVGTSEVTNINSAVWAAPMLEKIIWSFPTTACISGLGNLYVLREFELNGECDPDQVREEIEGLWKFPVFKHNPKVQNQEDIAAASASSSSAP
ncbi:unnamed protein product [Miscanthus lutarioriparius]|uniref:Rx N-terminal domain-containing protein n=1 Tax=Miscanthus lutarioriparius TaxID=422564 RepID=A0A811Q999_9POAL|nr:unnamed protein product [Miscanthus lutarioriparius]